MLIISGPLRWPIKRGGPNEFQSRNRDAYHFRSKRSTARQPSSSFNLAIEMLIISGHREPQTIFCWNSFNLAIEMLIISGQTFGQSSRAAHPEFQSRNRDAYHFRAMSLRVGNRRGMVSISQSRCLSFQEELLREAGWIT